MMPALRAICVVFCALLVTLSPAAWPHPGAINLYVDHTTTPGRLAPLPTYEPGWFALYPGIELSSETPGISVSFPANGVTPQTQFELEISQHLLYWDGVSVAPTDQVLRVVGPQFDNEGNLISSVVESYDVTASSRVQQGMTWGTYSGNDFWEADGLFFLDDLSAPHGIYALVYRVYSSQDLASHPFLVPLIYDPNAQWTPAERLAGVAQLRAAMNPKSGDFNSDGAFDCADVDALVTKIVGGSHDTDYDLTRDGLVDTADLQHWLADAGSARNPSSQPFLPGDANLDGVVDGSDFGVWNAHKFTAQAAWCKGDMNADGSIDGSDFGLWNSHKFTAADGMASDFDGTNPSPKVVGSTVPEPMVGWIWMVLSLVALRTGNTALTSPFLAFSCGSSCGRGDRMSPR